MRNDLAAAAMFAAALLMPNVAGAQTPAPDALSTMDYFAGTWQCNGTFPSTGATISSTISFDADAKLGGMVKHHDDIPPNKYHAIEVWVYSTTDQRYNASIVDKFGGVRQFTSPGWEGDRLTWSLETNGNPAAQMQRFVYEKQPPNAFRLDYLTSRDGAAYRVGDTLTCTRRGS